jgi:hypothetical protein
MKARHVLKATLLAVGEGAADRAFVEHMKGIYSAGVTTQSVKVDSANGGSPKDMIDYVVRTNRHTAYDRKFLLIDTDKPITQAERKKAKQEKIELVESTPLCLEGMLLEVLTQPIPANSTDCKRQLHTQLDGPATNKRSYKPLFDKPVLDATPKDQIKRLIALLSHTA